MRGGRLWLSAPLFYEEHEAPHDFFRYTQFGIRHLLESARFRVLSIQRLEGYLGTLSYQMQCAARFLPTRPTHYGGGLVGWVCAAVAVCLRPVFAASSFVFARLDLRHRCPGPGQCKNYATIAVKTTEE